jgi:hypothetical protein
MAHTNAVFISYRRADSAESAGRIYDRLVERFGEERVFKDVDSIQPGVAFADYIVDSIGRSAVELVIIGPRWLSVSSGWNRRRLDEPADFVRLEIESALRAGVPVIPVLVMGAALPPAQRLPDSLKRLPERNAIQVRPDPDFRRDMERVIAAVEYWMARPRSAPVVSAPVTPAQPITPPTTQPPVSLPPPSQASSTPAAPAGAAPTASLGATPWPEVTPPPTGYAPAPSGPAPTLPATATPITLPPMSSSPASHVFGPPILAAPAQPSSGRVPAKLPRVQPVVAIVSLVLVVALIGVALRFLTTSLGKAAASSSLLAAHATATTAAVAALDQVPTTNYQTSAPGSCDRGPLASVWEVGLENGHVQCVVGEAVVTGPSKLNFQGSGGIYVASTFAITLSSLSAVSTADAVTLEVVWQHRGSLGYNAYGVDVFSNNRYSVGYRGFISKNPIGALARGAFATASSYTVRMTPVGLRQNANWVVTINGRTLQNEPENDSADGSGELGVYIEVSQGATVTLSNFSISPAMS